MDAVHAVDTNTLAETCARLIRDGFVDYDARFDEVTRRARLRFERRDWAGSREDAVERIELYDRCVAETSALLESRLQGDAADRALWSSVRDRYAALIADQLDQELFKTFFNTLTRRFFRTRGVAEDIEFVALDIEPTDRITHPVARHSYVVTDDAAAMFLRVLGDYPFAIPYADGRVATLGRGVEGGIEEEGGVEGRDVGHGKGSV